MAVRNITKQLAGAEDLLIGTGTQEQIRNGKPLTISKISLITPVETIVELKALSVDRYNTALTLGAETIGDSLASFYYYDSSDSTTEENLPIIVIPNTLIGRWKKVNLS